MPVFVDANVLVYARDSSEVEKQRRRASAWVDELWRRRSGRLSTQVLYSRSGTRSSSPLPGSPGVRTC